MTATLPTVTLLPGPVKAAPQFMAIANLMFVLAPRKVIVRLPTVIFLPKDATAPEQFMEIVRPTAARARPKAAADPVMPGALTVVSAPVKNMELVPLFKNVRLDIQQHIKAYQTAVQREVRAGHLHPMAVPRAKSADSVRQNHALCLQQHMLTATASRIISGLPLTVNTPEMNLAACVTEED